MEITSMCRCCATEGSFKDIKNPYYWMGKEEVYGDMLRECFDVKLSSAEQGGICEVCITQLRNASNFKKQVLNTEEQFKRQLNDHKFKATIVKEELSADEDNDKFDSDDNGNQDDDDEDYVPEFEIPIKTETVEVKPKKRASTAKATTSRAKKTKTKKDEDSKSGLNEKAKTEADKPFDPAINHERTEKTNKVKVREKLKKKIMYNAKQILKCSNSTPIKCQEGLDYCCVFCDFKHQVPRVLKAHVLVTHSSESLATCRKKRLNEFLLKLDITDLKCKFCNDELETLEQIIEHIQHKHNIKMYTDVKNQILPFKFDDGPLTCFICKTQFANFRQLQVHVNTHYNNYVCEICGSGYVNEAKLVLHSLSHKTGTFTCSHCPKVFDTHVKKMGHERTHIKKFRIKCWECGERFSEQYIKDKHMIEKHGAEIPTCLSCGKLFGHPKGLRLHVKRVHLMERPHVCVQCGMKFNSPRELQQHSIKHTGERPYQCEVCKKCYGRRFTLKEHMRIHLNDRRFKCEYCELTFVQKCSWKGHMKNKHNELVK